MGVPRPSTCPETCREKFPFAKACATCDPENSAFARGGLLAMKAFSEFLAVESFEHEGEYAEALKWASWRAAAPWEAVEA